LCITEDRSLLEQIRKEADRFNWEVYAVANLAECSNILMTREPDIIVAEPHFSEIPSGLPVVFVRNGDGELRAIFDRLDRLKGERHFPRFDLHIDGERQIARIGATRLDLTLTELRLLRELAGVRFDSVARDVLEACALGTGGASRRALDVHICSLRKKLKTAGLAIQSVRGVGYRLNPCRKAA
jgi:DNA-binding response OmpR family regulator